MIFLEFFYYLGLLGVLGASFYKYRTLRHRAPAIQPPLKRPPNNPYPKVTLQIPIYNEPHVIGSMLDSIKAINYPKEKLQIQLLDDSTDHTSAIITDYLLKIFPDWDISHHQRKTREGFKAGALKEGLTQATGEFVAIFDVDFVIPPDFFEQTLFYFQSDHVGCVQASWSFINENANYLTKLQALALRAHFDIEQWTRYQLGSFLTFNGSAGVWRKAAILKSGNWSDNSLTEDLDLSFRAQLIGWKIVFIRDYKVPNLLPTRFIDFKRQQHRWAKGSIQCLRHLFKRILTSRLTRTQKLQAYLHLGRHLIYLFSLITLLSMPWVVSARVSGHWANLLDTAIFILSTSLIGRYFFKASGVSVTKFTFRFMGLCMAGISLLPTLFMAMASGFTDHTGEFVRTPKNMGVQSQSPRHFIKFYDIGDVLFFLYILGCIYTLFIRDFWISKPLIGMVAISASFPVFALIKDMILAMLPKTRGAP